MYMHREREREREGERERERERLLRIRAPEVCSRPAQFLPEGRHEAFST